MKFLLITLFCFSAFSQSGSTSLDFHELLYQEVPKAQKLIFTSKTSGDRKIIKFREVISKLKQEIDVLVTNFDLLDESCIEDLAVYQAALYSRFERILVVIEQHDEEDYSKNFIYNYKLEAWLFNYIGKDTEIKKKYKINKKITDEMMEPANKKKLIMTVSEIRTKVNNFILSVQKKEHKKTSSSSTPPPLNETKKYNQVIVPNLSRCTLTAKALIINGLVEEYKPNSKIAVSLQGYKKGATLGWITPEEVDSFYKTLKYMICEPKKS